MNGQAEQILRKIWDICPAAIVVTDPSGDIEYVNPAFERTTGYAANEAVGKNPRILNAGTLGPEVYADLWKTIASGRIWTGRLQNRRKDGSLCWERTTISPLCDEEGKILHYVAVKENVTAEEKRLRVSEERYAMILESVNDGVWDWDIPGGTTLLSPNYYSMLGYDDGEFLGTYEAWHASVHPDDLDRAESELCRSIESGEGFEVDLRMRLKSGAWRWFSTRGKAVEHDAAGNVLRMVGTTSDITARKAAEETANRLAAIVTSSDDAIIGIDLNSIVTSWNRGAEKIFGYTAAELVGTSLLRLIPPDRRHEEDAIMERIKLGESVEHFETMRVTRDGRLLNISVTASPIRDANGALIGVSKVAHDISARIVMQEALKVALNRAEAGSCAKSEFLSVMSHELRTPLNGVLGMADILASTPLDAEQQDFVKTIRDSGNRLLGIINDILDFASIEQGTASLESAPVALAALKESCCQAIRATAAGKGLRLRCETLPGVPEQITGDAIRIRRVLVNLLGNAAKFTSQGSVMLRIQPAFAEGGEYLDFCVQDTGPGIPPEKLGQIFHPFVQADSSSQRPFEGIGLGLAISQRLAEAIGGSITASSTPGKGSTFTFRLPTGSPVP